MLVRKSDGTMVEVMEVNNNPRALANNIATDLNNNSGVMNLSNGKTIELFPIPPTLSFTATSTDAGGSVTNYIFNNNSLTASTTNNGGGANTIVNTYGDGYSGKGYEQLFRAANAGRGILLKGITVKSTTLAGLLDSTFFTVANLKAIFADLQGAGVLPANINLDMAVRNTAFKDGILTVVFPFYLNALTQLSYLQPKNSAIYFTFFTEASSFSGLGQ